MSAAAFATLAVLGADLDPCADLCLVGADLCLVGAVDVDSGAVDVDAAALTSAALSAAVIGLLASWFPFAN